MEKVYPKERLKIIFNIIRDKTKIEVAELASLLNVTGATIRSDLNILEKQKLITRTHGGAMIIEAGESDIIFGRKDPSYKKRIQLHESYKKLIGKSAATLIEEEDNVMIDDGSTNLHVVQSFHKDKSITVITNGLNICEELVLFPKVSVISVGGLLDKTDLSFYGKIAMEIANNYYADKAFIGVSGISTEVGITAASELKAELKKVMIKNSKELVVVADHSKFNKISLMPVCPISEINTLITDSLTPKESIAALQNAGIKVVVAK